VLGFVNQPTFKKTNYKRLIKAFFGKSGIMSEGCLGPIRNLKLCTVIYGITTESISLNLTREDIHVV
jgi:hypothetical protein